MYHQEFLMEALFHFEFLQTQETTKFIFTLLQSKTINAKPEEYTIYPVKDENYNKKNKVFNKNLTKKIITKGKPFKTFVRYETSVKQAVKLECQSFDGTLDVTCIKGGFITQLEAEEMERIMAEA